MLKTKTVDLLLSSAKKMANQTIIILKDNVLGYVALRGSDQDVDKEARRFVAASNDSAVKALSKNAGQYDRADLVKILSVATVGETREYERGAWVYIPENPRDHSSLIRFYKKYHPVRYLETVIHGYPRHFSEEDVRAAPKTLPKNFIEYLLRRGTVHEIINATRFLFQLLTKQGVQGLEKLPSLTVAETPILFDKSAHGFFAILDEKGLIVGGGKNFTQALRPKFPQIVEEYLAYERYMLSSNVDNYSSNVAQRRAAQLLAEGFQTATPPDEPLTRLPDPNFPPTEVSEVFEYFLYYGSDIEVNRVANALMLASEGELDFNLKSDMGWLFLTDSAGFNRNYTRSDLLTILTCINPREVDRYNESRKFTEVSTISFGNRYFQNIPPEKDIRDHPVLAKYYRRNFVNNYIELLTNRCSTPLEGALLLDEIEAVCPANLLEHCLEYGTEKEVHDAVKSLHRFTDVLPTTLLVKKKKKGDLYTRGDLRLLLKESSLIDPNEIGSEYKTKIRGEALKFSVYNEIFNIKYATQKGRNSYIRQELALNTNPIIRDLIEGFGPPPYTKEQHRALLVHISGRI
jgi:hypothetical protein